MTAQLEHILSCADLPRVQILVVPRGASLYPGLAGAFVLARLPDGSTVANLDHQIGALVTDNPDDIARARRRVVSGPRGSGSAQGVTGPDQGSGKEMDLTTPRWRTASYSSTNGGNCVEVADNLHDVVLIRDTKDRDGGVLAFAPGAWRSFVASVRAVQKSG